MNSTKNNDLEQFQEKLTTIFLTDKNQPSRMILLQRAANKKFAPNLYTGTGGKFEAGEIPQQCAERELFEETGIKVPIIEFARLIFNTNQRIVCQFHGLYDADSLPQCPEGQLEWVGIDNLNDKKFIPTAKIFLDEWVKRNFNTKKPFTMFIEREDLQNLDGKIQSIKIVDGLHWTLPHPISPGAQNT